MSMSCSSVKSMFRLVYSDRLQKNAGLGGWNCLSSWIEDPDACIILLLNEHIYSIYSTGVVDLLNQFASEAV